MQFFRGHDHEPATPSPTPGGRLRRPEADGSTGKPKMTTDTAHPPRVSERAQPGDSRRYRRPLVLAIAASVSSEAVIFVVWGLILYPQGSILTKFLWTIVFCGLGMGSAVGAAVVLFVVDRLEGAAAVAATSLLSATMLGGGCNVLCYRLDTHYFHYFGGADSPALFIVNGVAMAAIGGAVVGWLLFTARGEALLDRIGRRAR